MNAGALTALRGAIGKATVAGSGREHIADLRDGLVSELDELLSVSATDEHRKAIVAIVGATGTGKSSLFNGLAEQPISPTGLRRPTTSHPVVWYGGDEPSFLEAGSVAVAGSDALLEALILVDAPDFDSSVDGHTQVVEALLRRADLCVFVASAKRYADEAAWAILRLARRRSIPIYFVLNRLPETGADKILDDYINYLRQSGLLTTARSPRMLLIPEQELPDQLLPSVVVAPLRRYLESLQRDDVRRDLLSDARAGRLESVAADTEALAAAIDREAELTQSLTAAARASFAVAAAELDEALEARPAPEELEAKMIDLARDAVAATVMAWASVGVDLPNQSVSSRLEEKARKALAEWHGQRPADRDSAGLEAVFDEEAIQFGELARSWAPPPALSRELRDLVAHVHA